MPENSPVMNKFIIYISYILSFLCIFPLATKAQTESGDLAIFHSPKYEIRAMWLTTIGGIDWPHSFARQSSPESVEKQKQELRNILDQLQRANINTVLIQTRVRATTIYPSVIEPWDGCLSGNPGVSPGYDALKFAIEECHRRGMECHAWVVTIPIGKWNKAGCKHLRSTHPELVRKIGDEGYLNPEHPGTAPYLAKICAEITRNYDIDGIHLDYIRYPETWKITVSRSQGREHITRIVQAINKAVKEQKPWVKMSCSPVGKFSDLSRYSSHGWNAWHAVCQDAQGWLRDGLMDQLYPMMYFRNDQFFPFAADWANYSYGKMVAPGLGIYFLDPREGKWQLSDVSRELHVLRQLGLGHTYFRSKFFTDNTKGIYNYVCRYVDLYPALVPPMTWYKVSKPTAPSDFNVEYGNSTQLSWTGVSPYYNIYASKHYPVDINDGRNLIRQRYTGNTITVGVGEEMFYAVTAMDRYGNESEPTQSFQKARGNGRRMLKNDGNTLQMPDDGNVLDAKYITIETLQGSIIATMPYNRKSIDIRNVPNGVYIIRSLNKKGITHRIGQFTVKR